MTTPRSGPIQVVVRERRKEGPDVVSLFLEPRSPVSYQAGQFLSIDAHQLPELAPLVAELEAKKGARERVRAYSLASGPHDALLRIVVKAEPYKPPETPYPPLLSPFLVEKLEVGRELTVVGFTGMYTLAKADEVKPERVLHVVAGSGLVPNLGLVRWDLETRPQGHRHLLLMSNRHRESAFLGREVDALAARFPDRLEVTHWLSSERGRLTEAGLREALARCGPVERAVAYLCGPAITMHERKAALARGEKPQPRFLESAVAWLQQAGVPRKQVHQESFA